MHYYSILLYKKSNNLFFVKLHFSYLLFITNNFLNAPIQYKMKHYFYYCDRSIDLQNVQNYKKFFKYCLNLEFHFNVNFKIIFMIV